jgi:hydrogenase-4 component F
MMIALPVLLPALAAALYAWLGWRPATHWLGTASAAGVLTSGIVLAVQVTSDGPGTAVEGHLYVDSLSAFMVIVIGVVSTLAAAASPAYLNTEIASGKATGRTARRYSMLVQAFIAVMGLAVLAADLGILWVAVEATTIVTAFLVGLRRTRAAVEAAWKYVVICSVGIALAFLGAVILNYAASEAGTEGGLNWVKLADTAGDLDPSVTRIAVVLLFIGFGAKAGLAPLHAWLADAHGQAPAPVSALMSGVLLAVAFYAVLRVKVVADAALGSGFARTLLVVMALASLALSATLLIAQRDFKRMLAYSSIEHVGLIALGAAVGSRLALTAVLLHVLGHGMGKTVAFLSSGQILQTTGSSAIAGVRGLGTRRPLLAAAFGLGVLALIGMPPFSLFASSLGIVRAGFAEGLGWPTTVALFFMLVAAAALLVHTSKMILGPPPDQSPPDKSPSDSAGNTIAPVRSAAVPLLAGLIACAAIGVTLGPLGDLLHTAAAIVGTTP